MILSLNSLRDASQKDEKVFLKLEFFMSDLLFPQLLLWLDIQTFQDLGQCLSKGEWWLLNRIDEGLFLVITMPGFEYRLIGIPHILQYTRQLCPRWMALPECHWCSQTVSIPASWPLGVL